MAMIFRIFRKKIFSKNGPCLLATDYHNKSIFSCSVWAGSHNPSAQYAYPAFYPDGSSFKDGDIGIKMSPDTLKGDRNEYSDSQNFMWRHPSSYCFVRSWGNDTSKILVTDLDDKEVLARPIVCTGNTHPAEVLVNPKKGY
jgi:hypothetical protein